ncbi:hypothetical protein BJV78DRAFT_1280734 [Lactifluus subvellereus]|nr:hypothetical protein BJV78DRAFT_1280734 [Lactifluus subvellereus]
MPTVTETSSPPQTSLDELPKTVLIDDPDADIILCSCDHQEFRVPKLYIVKISPVLREVVQSTCDSAHAQASLPSFHLSESGVILSSLLTFILPMPPVLPPTIEQSMELLSVSQKYEMDSISSHVREKLALHNPPFLRSETAFQVYSLAQKYGLRQEALQAACMALTFPITIEDLEDKLDIMPGAYLWKPVQMEL